MSKIYSNLLLNQKLTKEKLELVRKFDQYLIENYGMDFGIDSKDEKEDSYRMELIEHPIVKSLSNHAFVEALDIITIPSKNTTKIFGSLLNKKELEDKWSDTCIHYLALMLLQTNIVNEDKEDFFSKSDNVEKFIELEPVLSVLLSKHLQSLSSEEFDENLEMILNGKYNYVNSIATVISSSLPKNKKKEALKVIDAYYGGKTKYEQEYEALKETKNKSEYDVKRMSKLQTEIEQYRHEGIDDLIFTKEFVAKIATTKAMASRFMNIEEYTSMLLLIDKGLVHISEEKNQFFQNLMLTCLNAESYAKDKKKLFRSVNYILENIYENDNEYALWYAANEKAAYYNDEEFNQITSVLKKAPFEDDIYVKSIYELVTNENVKNEFSKEDYLKTIHNKDIKEIKKLTALQNYLAYKAYNTYDGASRNLSSK